MDFLLCSASIGDRIDASALSRYQLSQQLGMLIRTDFGSTSVFAPQAPTLTNDWATIFDGYAVIDGKLHHPFVGVDAHEVERWVRANPLTHGVYCIIRINALGVVEGFCDVTSQYTLFYWVGAAGFAISNNCHLIEQCLFSLPGVTVRRSAESISFSLGYGCHFGDKAAVQDVNTLPSRHTLTVADGALTISESISARALYGPDGDYDSLVDEAVAEMTSIAQAVTTSSVKKIACDLTGGADSRLALAAFLEYRKRIEIFTTAQYPRPDRIVCDHICHKYGLRGASLVPDNQDEYLPFDRIVSRGVYRTAGLKLLQADVGRIFFPDVCRITGYFGEMARNFGQLQGFAETPHSLAESYFQRRDAKSMLLTEDGRENLIATATHFLERIISSGLPAEQANRVMYCENRSRYHFGVSARLSNLVRVTIHPLYSIPQIRAAGLLSVRDLTQNRLGFELTVRLGGLEYALEPRAESKWPLNLIPPEQQAEYKLVSSISVGQTPLAPTVPIRVGSLFQRVPQRLSAFSRAMRAKGLPGRFRNVPLYQEILQKIVPMVDSSDELWRYVDRTQAIAVAEAPPDALESAAYGNNPRLVMANIAQLAAGLIWYIGEDEAVAVSLPHSTEDPWEQAAPQV